MSRSRLTEAEQNHLLDDFHSQVYDDENDFYGGNHAQFQDEGNVSDRDDGGDEENGNDADLIADLIDENLDTDIPEDERDDEITLPGQCHKSDTP